MGSMSIWHWIIVLLVVVMLFGRGKMSEFMGDLAKGIKSFKKGLAEDETPPAPAQTEAVKSLDHQATPAAGQNAAARPVEPGKAS